MVESFSTDALLGECVPVCTFDTLVFTVVTGAVLVLVTLAVV